MCSGNHEMCEAIIEAHRGAGADWMSTPVGDGVFQEQSEDQKRLRTEWGTRKGRKPRLKGQEAMWGSDSYSRCP